MKTTLTKMMAFFAAIFLFASVAVSQELITTAGTVGVCPGSVGTVQVPITVQNFVGVSSISLSMIIDLNNVTYQSYTVHPTLAGSGGFLIVNNPGNKVKAAFFGITPITLPDNAVLFTFTFNVSGSSPLTWDLITQGDCQYSDFYGEPLPAIFINGAINSVLPNANISSPAVVCLGNPADVTVDFTAGTAPFTLVYNDGVNPDVTVVTSDDPYVFTENITSSTTWTIVSITDGTGCENPSVNATTNTQVVPAPASFTVSGGGSFCQGGSGVNVELDGSQAGLIYDLYLDGVYTNYSILGYGAPLYFVDLTEPGTYTIMVNSDCGNLLMAGEAIISVLPPPAVSLAPFTPVCYLTAPFTLSGGLPEGGVYEGYGVDNGMFYSEISGHGDFTITYTYTDLNGCSGFAQQIMTVYELPNVYTEYVNPMCVDADPITLVGNPQGGQFSGAGIVDGVFYPSVAGSGIHAMSYIYTDQNGCSNGMGQDITVYALPELNMDPIPGVCYDAAPFQLIATPSGGWFDGNGVMGEFFYPDVAGAGSTSTITYYYTSVEGCSASVSGQVVVFPVTVLTIEPIGPFCVDAAPVTLQGTPQGGVFSGTGVINNMFSPALAGSGSWNVVYSYTDENGCVFETLLQVDVFDLPQVFFYPVDPICLNAAAVELYGFPEGGVFSGPGVNGNFFDPALAGVGSFLLTYTYTDANSCTNASTQLVSVNDIPVLSFDLPGTICMNADVYNMMPNPDGGWFEGPGAYGNYFYPADAGVGTWIITYHYTDINGCQVMLGKEITVLPVPEVTIGPVQGPCIDSQPFTLIGMPEGGYFEGTGVSNGQFYPALAGVGDHLVYYYYTDGNGCSNNTYTYITVYPLPEVYSNIPWQFCIDAGAFEVIGFPVGGVVSGAGVDNGFFYPSMAGAGTHEVAYTYTDFYGCTNSYVVNVEVIALPQLSFNLPSSVCVDADAVLLEAFPEGGFFSGTAVYGSWFYPWEALVGTFTLTYQYSDAYGCTNSISKEITVLPLPELAFAAIGPYCVDSESVTLVAMPEGGLFSGTGVYDGVFYPDQAGAGYHQITYTYTDGNGCTNSASIEVAVYSLPSVSITVPPSICYGPDIAYLVGYPEGGVFSGEGVMGNEFHPLDVIPGEYLITYTYTDEHGCTNSASATIMVYDIPYPFLEPIPNLCVNSAPVELLGTPAGGFYQGSGVSGNYFDPAVSGPGTHQVFYVYINEYGCSNFYFRDVVVFPLPEVSFDLIPSTCLNAAPIPLAGVPAGGLFVGQGVENDMFVPSLAGIGTFDVVYAYTDANGCTNTVVHSITVNESVNVVFDPLPPFCLNSDPLVLYALPEGGVFTGTGVVDNIFYPSLAGEGSWEITYTYNSGNDCQGSATQLANVYPVPEVTLDPVAPVCFSGAPVTLNGLPEGGVYSGPGLDGNTFYPSWAGVGTWEFNYTYMNQYGCVAMATIEIMVVPEPVITVDPVDPVCINAAPFALMGTPQGGSFAGPGVDNNIFYPAVAGVGEWYLVYTYADVYGCFNSVVFTITVLSLPEFTTQPLDASVNDGDPASFEVNAMNVSTYLWQESTDGGVTWNDLADGGVYLGTTGEVLSINQTSLAMNGYLYRCLAYGQCIEPVASEAAMLTVLFTEITVIAGNATACEGEVVIPLTVENFYNVAAMSLALDFNPAVLSFNTHQNVNPLLMDGLLSVNQLGSQVKIGFFSVNPVNIGSGLLLELVFTGVAGTTDLSWDLLTAGNCELLDLEENILTTNYTNGQAQINALPADVAVVGGGVYCFGANGVEIGLGASELDITYYLVLDGNIVATIIGNGNPMSFGYFTAEGTYTVHAMNMMTNCMLDLSGNAVVEMNAELVVNAGPDQNIFIGDAANLAGAIAGGTGSYTYYWTPVDYLDDPNSLSPVATPTATIEYVLHATDQLGCTAEDAVTVFVDVPLDYVTGTLTYMNAANTPINDATVFLKGLMGNILYTTTTDANGAFIFNAVAMGDYMLDATTTKPWGGGNAADGLLMLKQFVGQTNLTGLRLLAGDVTGQGMVNAHDALNTLRRFTGLLADFSPVGDWVFENPVITVDYLTVPNVNFHALCMADVNTDYIPGAKLSPAIELNISGNVSPVNHVVTLPVYAEENMTLGAISLILELPAGYTTQNLSLANASGEVSFNQVGSELRIGWCSLEPMSVAANDAFMHITLLQTSSAASSAVAITGASVLHDDQAQSIPGARIRIPKISLLPSQLNLAAYPNPMNSNARVSYTLATEGQVSLKLFNLLGEEVSLLVNAMQTAGEHVLNLDASTLSQGTYLLKLESNNQIINKMITVNK